MNFVWQKDHGLDNNNLVILLRDNIGLNQGELGDGDSRKTWDIFKK